MFTTHEHRRSRTTEERQHILTLLQVARAYYEEGCSQAEIASRIGYSRPTVSRLLAEARERGMVRVRIFHTLERVISLEAELRERFNLKLCRVADPEDVANTQASVARCAADMLTEIMTDNVLLSISNGLAVAATVDAMPELELPRARVVQMIGSIGHSDVLLDSVETCRRMSGKLGCGYHGLPVPLVVPSASVAEELRRDEQIGTTLELAARADIALVGVGAVSRGRSGRIFDDFIDADTEQVLNESTAVGHICGHHFTREGRHIPTPLCRRTISVDPERMRTIPYAVGVAWSAEKVPALVGALKGHFINCLVTDRATALALISCMG